MRQFAALSATSNHRLQRLFALIEPADQQVEGTIGLCVTQGVLSRDQEGRSAGLLCGTLFNDMRLRARLVERGAAGPGASISDLVTASVAQFGPAGLARLRFGGVLATMHRSQRLVLAATGAMGVGPLYLGRGDDFWVATSDARLLKKVGLPLPVVVADDAPPVQTWVGSHTGVEGVVRVVAGTALMLSERGPVVQRIRWDDDADVYFRQVPPELLEADAAGRQEIFADAVVKAGEAARRNHGPLWLGDAHNSCQQELRKIAISRGFGDESADAACRWSWLGARTLSGRLRWPEPLASQPEQDAVATLEQAWRSSFDGVAVRPPFCAPMTGLAAEDGQRWLRHTLFAHALAERAWYRAALNGSATCWPHLDPRVVAIGAVRTV